MTGIWREIYNKAPLDQIGAVLNSDKHAKQSDVLAFMVNTIVFLLCLTEAGETTCLDQYAKRKRGRDGKKKNGEREEFGPINMRLLSLRENWRKGMCVNVKRAWQISVLPESHIFSCISPTV